MFLFELINDLPPISDDDIALMTKKEFVDYRNKDGKIHSNQSYDFDLKSLNRETHKKIVFDNMKDMIIKTTDDTNYLIYNNKDLVGVVYNNILYYNYYFNLSRYFPFSYRDGDNELKIDPEKMIKVKYLTDILKNIDNIVDKNLKEYPILLNNIKVDGENYTIRTEEQPYKKNSGKTIVILNDEGYIVASAQNEWGATLIVVAKEYRGKNLGTIIGKIWYENNPKYKSGGFTISGEKNAIKLWEDKVRTYLSKGIYSEYIKRGLISKERIDNILSGLSDNRNIRQLIQPPKTIEQKKPLVYIDDGVAFIIYDEKFFDEQDDKYIYSYGFVRENSKGNLYPYKFDYDKDFKKMANIVLIQMVHNIGEPLYIGGRSDFVDFQELKLDNAEIDNDFVTINRDIVNLKLLSGYEKAYRKKHDNYDEIFNMLISQAESKWN